jgi:hypothetical protein
LKLLGLGFVEYGCFIQMAVGDAMSGGILKNEKSNSTRNGYKMLFK